MRREPAGLPGGVVSSILDNLPLAILVLPGDATPLYANAAAIALLGEAVTPSISAGDLVRSLGARHVGSGDPYPIQRMPIVRAMDGETATVDDMEVDGPVGAVILEVWAAPVRASRTSVPWVVATFRDVTDQKDAQDSEAALGDDIPQQGRWFEAMRAIRDIIAPATALDQALDVVVQQTRELLDGESTSIAVREEEGFLAIRAAEGRGAESLKGTRVPVEGSIMGDVVAMGAAAVLDDVACLGTLAEPVAGLDLGPALFVPLTVGERALGSLCVARSKGRALFTDLEVAVAEAFAGLAVFALERAGILESVSSAQGRLSEVASGRGDRAGALEEAIDTLASIALRLRGDTTSTDSST